MMADETKVPTPTPQRTASVSLSSEPSTLSNVLAIAGFIIVLVVIIWGLFHIAQLVSPWFPSSSSQKTLVSVQAPASAISGAPFTVSWSSTGSAKGSYSLVYPCNDVLQLRTAGAESVLNTIPCGVAYGLTGTSVSLVPLLSGTATVNEPLTVLFVPSGASAASAQGSANVAIKPGNAVSGKTQRSKSAQGQPALGAKPAVQYAAHAPVGPTDLSVRIISATIDAQGSATITFDIANDGSNASGPYYFEAFLPMRSAYTYSSPLQSSLQPGSHIVNTLRYTQAVAGEVAVIVDPSNAVQDTNRSNNYAGASLTFGQPTAQPYSY